MTQAEAQQRSYDISRKWYAGLTLTYGGVDLGWALQYEIMSVLGRIFMGRLDAQTPPSLSLQAKTKKEPEPDA